MNKYLSTLRASALFLALSISACGASSPAAESHDHAAAPTHDHAEETAGAETGAQALVPPSQAQVGDRTTCVVSGEEFVVAAESPRVEHDGHSYPLCCGDCVGPFQANPGQYVGRFESSEP